MCVCVCACACVRACVCVLVCVCVWRRRGQENVGQADMLDRLRVLDSVSLMSWALPDV